MLQYYIFLSLTSSNFVNKTNMKLPHNFDHPATPDNIWVSINNRQLVVCSNP